uniref:HVA22-like protein n=1 Tax=Zea mays TaxID=4577 RepID=A0A804PN94_MAIZE
MICPSTTKIMWKKKSVSKPLVSLAYPLYASVRAIETKSAVDDQQWLTYWVLYSFITLFELTFAPVLEWLPFWSYAKLFFNCWLVLPQFNGAAHVYEHFVRPMIVNQQVVNIWYIPKKDESSRPDDVISAAQRYIEQNGSKAFENLVNKFKSSNPRRSILEEVEVERRARIQLESEAREVNPFFNPEYQY